MAQCRLIVSRRPSLCIVNRCDDRQERMERSCLVEGEARSREENTSEIYEAGTMGEGWHLPPGHTGDTAGES